MTSKCKTCGHNEGHHFDNKCIVCLNLGLKKPKPCEKFSPEEKQGCGKEYKELDGNVGRPLKRRCLMTPVEVLKLALSKEEQAIKFYQDLSTKHPAIQELLSFLTTEEQKHKKMLEEKISELTKY